MRPCRRVFAGDRVWAGTGGGTANPDFVARLAVTEVVERLKAAGIAVRVHKGSVLDGDIEWCVKGRVGDVVFDILPPVVPLEFERAVTVELGRSEPARRVLHDAHGIARDQHLFGARLQYVLGNHAAQHALAQGLDHVAAFDGSRSLRPFNWHVFFKGSCYSWLFSTSRLLCHPADQGFSVFNDHALEPLCPKGASPLMPFIEIAGKPVLYRFHVIR